MLHVLASFGKHSAIYDKAVVLIGYTPVEPVAKMPDEAPVERSPTPRAVLKAVEGVFARLIKGDNRSFHQIMNTVDMQKNQVYQNKHKMTRCVSIPLPDACRRQMAPDTKHPKELLDSQIEVCKTHLQYSFDLSLKRYKLSTIHKVAPLVWFLLVSWQTYITTTREPFLFIINNFH